MTRPGSPFLAIPEPGHRGTCRPAFERISEVYRSIGSKRFDPCRASSCLANPSDICTWASLPRSPTFQSIPSHTKPRQPPHPDTSRHRFPFTYIYPRGPLLWFNLFTPWYPNRYNSSESPPLNHHERYTCTGTAPCVLLPGKHPFTRTNTNQSCFRSKADSNRQTGSHSSTRRPPQLGALASAAPW